MKDGRRTLPEEALRALTREAWIPVAGLSMEPLLPCGSRVRLGPADAVPAVGATVLFPLGDMLAVHRVVGRRRNLLVTKGDASFRAEEDRLAPSRLLGVVVEAERGNRRASLTTLPWRVAGRIIAFSSRLWNLVAGFLPPALLNHPTRLSSRAARRLLRMGNRVVPAAVDLLMRSSWKPVGSGRPPRGPDGGA